MINSCYESFTICKISHPVFFIFFFAIKLILKYKLLQQQFYKLHSFKIMALLSDVMKALIKIMQIVIETFKHRKKNENKNIIKSIRQLLSTVEINKNE